jgi:hypothetical protein
MQAIRPTYRTRKEALMSLSVNKFTYEGQDEFDLNFALGYASRSDVSAFADGNPGTSIAFDWLTSSKVELAPGHGLSSGQEVVFQRTVSKSSLPVDLTQPGQATRENLTLLSRHVMYAMHEVLDGRVSDVSLVSSAVFDSVNSAVNAALESFLFRAQFVQDIVIRPTYTAAETITYTSGSLSCEPEDVLVYVETNPAVPVEVLVSSNGQVVYSATIDGSGFVTPSTNLVQFSAGPIDVSITGGNYISGLEAAIVFPCFRAVDVDFSASAVPDLSQQLEDEVNA